MAKKTTTTKRQEPVVEPGDGSAQLKSPKHEIFAQLHASGEPVHRAYANAGFKGKDPTEGGSRILGNPSVARRVSFLVSLRASALQDETAKAAKNAGIDKEWVMGNLKEVAERCMQSRPVLDAKGERVMVETKDGEVAPAFVFDPKGAIGALVPLGKELGMFVERKEIKVSQLETMSDEQLEDVIRRTAEELGLDILKPTASETRH